ncbi:dynamin family protein [Chamaesiphon sp. VAR_48_metabat_135_sub]|uniref:dynamin family protein n=1 Tax=Chamaesiphon sp. VAR_48_metabat_135_sub TaxID=2964699 RepID=UPI00286B5908|nr:dynamin family protein [Chamaesiphon sp. VAR_48_metabat_135_sub]
MLLKYIDREVKTIRREWQTHRRKIANQISPSQRSILTELDDIFLKATAKLLVDLQSPTLTIVTTGTTSSGKSTLVNLLCGAEIIPVAVQEMSAGLVTIEYNQNTSIHIDRTLGALWECGDWYHISDREIYNRLATVMNRYLEAKYNGSIDISYPQIRIEYPIRLLAKDSRLQLPEGIKLRIVDLPGLSHQEDIENLSLLKTCNRALFLVTYNSAETDRQKVNMLLQGVVEQLKIIGGLSNNMWFLFNRIDVFHGDKDRVASEEKFIDRTRSEIDKLLTKHHLQIEPKQVAKISTMPALLSLLMGSKDDGKRIEAANRLDRNFNFLIPENIANDLPRNPAKWSPHEHNRVAAAIWDVSYGKEFDRLLIDNIQTNLTNLIFLPIIQEFEQGFCLEISKWADKRSKENIIEAASISYVKNQSDRLLSRIDRSVRILIKFRKKSALFKQLYIFWLNWLDDLSLIFRDKGNS